MRHAVVRLVMIVSLLLGVSGCGVVVREGPGEVEIPRQWGWAGEREPYLLMAEMALTLPEIDLPNQLPGDIEAYCTAYRQLSESQRLRFWGDFLAAISYHESKHDTGLKYQEKFRDNTGFRVVSRGLLQLSFESSRGYGCPLDKATQLHDPAKNIDCGARILNKWILHDGVISENSGWLTDQWKGAARYWAVLRRPATRALIQAQIQERAYCNI